MLLAASRLWVCNRCRAQRIEPVANAGIPMHNCPGLGMLSVPLVADGADVDVRVIEREDYIGREKVTLVDGRPVMAVQTHRADGSHDTVAYAGVATVSTKK